MRLSISSVSQYQVIIKKNKPASVALLVQLKRHCRWRKRSCSSKPLPWILYPKPRCEVAEWQWARVYIRVRKPRDESLPFPWTCPGLLYQATGSCAGFQNCSPKFLRLVDTLDIHRLGAFHGQKRARIPPHATQISKPWFQIWCNFSSQMSRCISQDISGCVRPFSQSVTTYSWMYIWVLNVRAQESRPLRIGRITILIYVRWDVTGNSWVSVVVPDTSNFITLFEQCQFKVFAHPRNPVREINAE